MEFKTDIFELSVKKDKKINLIGLKLPSSKDVFFRAKQEEIFQQYEAARIFLRETENEDWEHWFTCNNDKYIGVFELIYTGNLFEVALMYYNIIVDLSWALCNVSAEYAIYEKDKATDLTGMLTIEEAFSKLRDVENSVVSPSSQGNPFQYLKMMSPEFKEAIDLIIDFWNTFSNSETRKLYNYIKHKGKPLYEEIEKFAPNRLIGLKLDKGECPVDIRDVQKKVKLKEAISDLKDFDDETLFPYIKRLFELLEKAVDPSPLIL